MARDELHHLNDTAESLHAMADELDELLGNAEATMGPIADATTMIAEKFDVLPVEVQMHLALHTWGRHQQDAERLFHAIGMERLSPEDTLKIKGYLALLIAVMTYLDLLIGAKIPVIDQEKRKTLVTVSKLMDRKLFEQQAAS